MIHPSLRWALALAAMALVATLAGARLAAAKERANTAALNLAETQRQLDHLASLEASAPELEVGERPPQDLIARVHAALQAAGLPGQLLQEVVPQADVAASAGSTLRRQAVAVRLRACTPADLGRFLVAWQDLHPAWVPTAIEWNHRAQEAETNLYELVLTVTATYRIG